MTNLGKKLNNQLSNYWKESLEKILENQIITGNKYNYDPKYADYNYLCKYLDYDLKKVEKYYNNSIEIKNYLGINQTNENNYKINNNKYQTKFYKEIKEFIENKKSELLEKILILIKNDINKVKKEYKELNLKNEFNYEMRKKHGLIKSLTSFRNMSYENKYKYIKELCETSNNIIKEYKHRIDEYNVIKMLNEYEILENVNNNNLNNNNKLKGGKIKRKCPEKLAKEFSLKTIKTGIDGKKWIVVKRKDGKKTWKRFE